MDTTLVLDRVILGAQTKDRISVMICVFMDRCVTADPRPSVRAFVRRARVASERRRLRLEPIEKSLEPSADPGIRAALSRMRPQGGEPKYTTLSDTTPSNRTRRSSSSIARSEPPMGPLLCMDAVMSTLMSLFRQSGGNTIWTFDTSRGRHGGLRGLPLPGLHDAGVL